MVWRYAKGRNFLRKAAAIGPSRCGPPQKSKRKAVAYRIAAASAATSAGGVTSAPIARKRQAVTSIFCRRKATSQRMVAREPVTEKFGPRSTPIRIAATTEAGRWSLAATEPATRPTGRLLAMLAASAVEMPTAHAAPEGDC